MDTEKKPASKLLQTVERIQLPLWPDTIRGLPNVVAQSALFTANSKEARKSFHRQTLASQDGMSIIYTGEELRMDDEDILLQLIHISRLQPVGEQISFSTYSLIKALGWSMNQKSYERVLDSMVRMKATNATLRFMNGNGDWVEYHESLIASAEHGGKGGADCRDSLWRVRFHKNVLVLFGDAAYTEVDWKTRMKLPPLAKKLHGLFISQEDPLGMSVERLQTIVGSRIKLKRQFRFKLRAALEVLVERKFLQSYVIDPATDLVRVKKAPRALSFSA